MKFEYWDKLKALLLEFEETGEWPKEFGYFELFMGLIEVIPQIAGAKEDNSPTIFESFSRYTYAPRKAGFVALVGQEAVNSYNEFIVRMGEKYGDKLQPTSKALKTGEDIESSRLVGIRRLLLDMIAVSLMTMDGKLLEKHMVTARKCGRLYVEGKAESEMPRMSTPTDADTRPASYPPGFIADLLTFLESWQVTRE